MDQETELQKDDLELSPEELEALGESADVLNKEESETTAEPAGAETTPAPSKRGNKAAYLNLSAWKMRRKRGRARDILMQPEIDVIKQQLKENPNGLVQELFDNALRVLRGVNYWKQSAQHISTDNMWDHIEEQEQKPFEFQQFLTFYMDSACHEIVLIAEDTPLSPEVMRFAAKALEEGLRWMRRFPQGCDWIKEIETGLEQIKAATPRRPNRPYLKPVDKPPAHWVRLMQKQGRQAEVDQKMKEYEEYVKARKERDES